MTETSTVGTIYYDKWVEYRNYDVNYEGGG
jgi:hypothetical protein